MDSKTTGILGEKITIDYLENKGYQILDKNYFSKFERGPRRGEIDIVAKKEGTISFVEVKTLRQAQEGPFNPEQKVDHLKQRKIIKAAQSWLIKNKIPLDSKWQIDVVAINLENNQAKIRHFTNAVF